MIIQADVGENHSGIPAILENEYGIKVIPLKLNIGDYIIDSKTVVERKTAVDFGQSIIDGRLFKQAAIMKKFFERPLMIVEGDIESLSHTIHIHPHAVKGALVSTALAWQISVLFSQDAQKTALLLWLISAQQIKSLTQLSYRPGRQPKRLSQRQLYILQGLPGVGPKVARRLIDHFKSVEAVVTAPKEELIKIHGLGQKKARKIREILTADCGE